MQEDNLLTDQIEKLLDNFLAHSTAEESGTTTTTQLSYDQVIKPNRIIFAEENLNNKICFDDVNKV